MKKVKIKLKWETTWECKDELTIGVPDRIETKEDLIKFLTEDEDCVDDFMKMKYGLDWDIDGRFVGDGISSSPDISVISDIEPIEPEFKEIK